MMVLRYYANAPATTLESSCSAVATSIIVVSTAGLPISYPYTLILDRGTATEEAVSVTAAGGTTLTVTRGIDDTTAFAHAIGATVEHGITAQDIREPNTHVNSDNGVHGVTGDVVGTSDTQTLTGKTVDLSDNTVTGTKAEFETAVSDGNPVWEDEIGVWAAYTPSLTNITGTIVYARYVQIGKTVHVQVEISLTAAVGGTMAVALPVTPRTGHPTGQSGPIGVAFVLDPGVTAYPGHVIMASVAGNGTVNFLRSDATNQIWNATTPLTWASGDAFGFSVTYEAA